MLGHVDTFDEVEEYVSALLQMYREQGHYLERIYKWANRVSIDEIKKQIMENAGTRLAYAKRFSESQLIAQHDPWASRTDNNMQANEFSLKPVAAVEVVA